MYVDQILLIACALLLAVGAGYLFGRSVPSWEEDYLNDPHPIQMQYHAGWGMSG